MISVTIAGKTFEIETDGLILAENELTVLVDGQTVKVNLKSNRQDANDFDWLIIDGRPYEFSLDHEFRLIKSNIGAFTVDIRDRESVTTRPLSNDGRIKAPIPGLISQVLVAEGNEVDIGQPLFVLEAMKMENEIRAPISGTVKVLHVTGGQSVALHEILAEIN